MEGTDRRLATTHRRFTISGCNGHAMPAAARAVSRLRFAYFAQASDAAGRYGIVFDEVLTHLWRARHTGVVVRLRRVRHLEDVVHAVACLRHCSMAWSDLAERYESLLVRRFAPRLGEVPALLVVRRVFSQLRGAAARSGATPGSLGHFVGDCPLRTWLCERTMDQLGRRHSVWFRRSPSGDGVSPAGVHTTEPALAPPGEAPLPCVVELARFIATGVPADPAKPPRAE